MTQRLVPWAILAAAALAGCKDQEGGATTVATEPLITVGRENITVASVAELRSGPLISGSLAPERAATVRAEVSGSVLRTNADAGQRVKRGQLLGTLDDTAVRDTYLSARSAVRSAEAALEIARRNAERAARLAKAGALPERDLETARWEATNAEGTLADARARLATASEQLEDTRIRAPFTGIVSERQADAGDVVQVGSPLFTVVDPRSLRLEASVPAGAIGRLKVGTPVEFRISGVERRMTGRIDRINPVVDSATRQVRIYASLPNVEESMVAGLFAEGRVTTDTKRAVAVPITAVDNRGTSPALHLVKGGRVREARVQLGIRDEVSELVEVVSGVAPGDTVLLGSAQGVSVGSRIRVLEEEAAR
jgi:RND family efflux transporter MFP subunit